MHQCPALDRTESKRMRKSSRPTTSTAAGGGHLILGRPLSFNWGPPFRAPSLGWNSWRDRAGGFLENAGCGGGALLIHDRPGQQPAQALPYCCCRRRQSYSQPIGPSLQLVLMKRLEIVKAFSIDRSFFIWSNSCITACQKRMGFFRGL